METKPEVTTTQYGGETTRPPQGHHKTSYHCELCQVSGYSIHIPFHSALIESPAGMGH